MSVLTLGRNLINVIPVKQNSHSIVTSRHMSVYTLGRNPTNVIPVEHNSQVMVI